MAISMELIDEMRKRTNCSYQEAKELLEKHNGDLVDAIIEFEKKHGSGSRHSSTEKNRGFGKKIKGLIQKGFVTRFIIEKDGNTVLNIPVNVLILAVLITMPIFWLYVIGFIVIYFMGYKIRFRKEEGQEVDVSELVDELGSKVKTATEKMREKPTEEKQTGEKKEKDQGVEKKDDYNEITVE